MLSFMGTSILKPMPEKDIERFEISKYQASHHRQLMYIQPRHHSHPHPKQNPHLFHNPLHQPQLPLQMLLNPLADPVVPLRQIL
jgi:hypothetical protein